MKKEKTKKQIITALCPSIDHKTGKVISPKKDRRTKAELVSELEGVRSHNDVLLRQHSIKLLNDGEQFDAGYKAGVKFQQEREVAKNNWWKFW